MDLKFLSSIKSKCASIMCGTYLTGITNIYLRSANSDPGISIYWDGVKGTQIDDNQIGIPSYSTFYVNSYSQGSGNVCISKDTGLTTIGGCLKLLTIPACSASEPSLFINAGGCIVSGVSSGGGVNWAGTTANGLGTYVSSTCICSNPNLTFDGSTLLLCGTLRMPTVPAKSSGDNQVVYANAAGCVVTGATVDISSNLGTGDLLYYNGSTISGSTLVQASSTEVRMENNCLMLCSNAAKVIGMCAASCTGTMPALTICGGNNDCCIPTTINILAGCGSRSTTGFAYGGCLYICSGPACQTYTGGATGCACGGHLYINAGCAYNGYTAGAGCANGGYVFINGGPASSFSTQTNARGGWVQIAGGSGGSCGGSVYLSSGYGSTCYGDIIMYAGGVQMNISSALNCGCINRRLDVYGCSLNIGFRVCYGCGYGCCWIASSDCRLKKDIEPLSGALSKITQLQGVRYHDCDDAEHLKNQIGLIAQDVECILPEIVSCIEPTEEEKEKYGITDIRYGLSYDKLTAVLVEAIKEQQAQINELKAEIVTLKGC